MHLINRAKILILYACIFSFFQQFCMKMPVIPHVKATPKKKFLVESGTKHLPIQIKFAEMPNQRKLANTLLKIKKEEVNLIVVGVPGIGGKSYLNWTLYSNYLRNAFELNPKNTRIFISSGPGFEGVHTQYGKESYSFQDYKEEMIEKDPSISYETIQKQYNDEFFPNDLIPDFGQKNCQKCFEETVVKKISNLKLPVYRAFFYGNSQGTATVLNYVANLVKNKKYDEESNLFTIGGKKIQIEAIILEAPLATGISAISHTLKKGSNNPIIESLIDTFNTLLYPHNKMLLYLGARINPFVTLSHNPKGQQPIQSMRLIPSQVPIVIAHSEDDREVPFSDGKALYYVRARNNQSDNHNDYFIGLNGRFHTTIFSMIPGHEKEYHHPLEEHFIKNSDGIAKEITYGATLRFVPCIFKALYPNKTENATIVKLYKDHFQPESDFGKKEYENLLL